MNNKIYINACLATATPGFPWEGFMGNIPTIPSTDGGAATTPSAASPTITTAPEA